VNSVTFSPGTWPIRWMVLSVQRGSHAHFVSVEGSFKSSALEVLAAPKFLSFLPDSNFRDKIV
jgi:hypothetical protein